jgi:plastocyanin
MERGRLAMILAPVVALGLVAASCGGAGTTGGAGGGGGGGPAEEQAGAFVIADANDHGAADLSGQSETSLELDDFYFEPTVLVGEPGQTLSIELENEGQAAHTFTLDDGTVDEEVGPGDKVEVDVDFPDSGHLRFTCRFHAGGGMMGAMSVEGDLGATGAESQAEDGGGGGGGGGGEDTGPGYG